MDHHVTFEILPVVKRLIADGANGLGIDVKFDVPSELSLVEKFGADMAKLILVVFLVVRVEMIVQRVGPFELFVAEMAQVDRLGVRGEERMVRQAVAF